MLRQTVTRATVVSSDKCCKTHNIQDKISLFLVSDASEKYTYNNKYNFDFYKLSSDSELTKRSDT